MSTFYSDGYQDGKNGFEASPPDVYTRHDGGTTDVYAREYMDGFNAGEKALLKQLALDAPFDSMLPGGANDANFDCYAS